MLGTTPDVDARGLIPVLKPLTFHIRPCPHHPDEVNGQARPMQVKRLSSIIAFLWGITDAWVIVASSLHQTFKFVLVVRYKFI